MLNNIRQEIKIDNYVPARYGTAVGAASRAVTTTLFSISPPTG